LRLDFNVLWVDDQPERVVSQITAITKRMEEEGFHFAPTLCQSIDEVKKEIADNVFTDEVDLILVDWDLGNGIVGQDAIAEIRSMVPYKDVVFYSAQTAPDTLRKAAFDKGVEGIYCASREQLVEEVFGVFESLVKKVLDLDHARGIVMGATSDIDYIVNECLLVVHGKLDNAGKDAMLKEGLAYIQKRIEALTETAKKLEGATTLAEFFEAHLILTANDRLRMLGGALKAAAFAAHKGYRPHIVTYQQKVVPDRNILGHMVLVPEGKPQSVTDNKGKAISVQETRELRRLILDLRLQFRNLLAALQAQDGPVAGAAPAAAGPAK
jgi:hypothetical protein